MRKRGAINDGGGEVKIPDEKFFKKAAQYQCKI